jgi:hypothetical protein
VSDRITLTLGVDQALQAQIEVHESLIAGETLATEVLWDTAMERSVAIEGTSIGVTVARRQ